MKNNLIAFLIVLYFSFFTSALQAQNLFETYELAVKNDIELQIAESNYQSALEQVPLATSSYKPQISFTADRGIIESNSSATGSNTNNRYGYSLNLTQSIYNAENLANIDAAEASVLTAEAQLESSRQALILRVSEAYFDILAAEDFVDFAGAEKIAIGRQLEQAQKRYEVGLIAITDVKEAQARFDNSVAQLLLSENLLENAYQALLVITADASTRNLARPEDNITLDPPSPANSQQWVEMARNSNPDLLAALSAQRAADFERQRQNKAGYPTIDLNASISDANVNDETLGDFDQEDIRLSIELNYPLYTGGRVSAATRQAESNYVNATNNALLQRRQVEQQTRNAYLGVVSGISQVIALRQAQASSNTALEATEAGFKVGTRTSVDVLVSLQEIYAARRNLARARYDYLLNTLRLKQAAGVLQPSDLERIDQWLIN